MKPTHSLLLACLAPALLLACGEAPGMNGDDEPGPDAGTDGGSTVTDDCPSMFRQDVLPTYEIDISPAEWAELEQEFHHRAENEAAGLNPKPYHPVQRFQYVAGDVRLEATDVQIRLKGNSSWAQTIAFDSNPKMQFVVSFNELAGGGDSGGRFLGVRKLELDMPRTDQTFIRQRLALKYLRETGVPAQCANNARLVINGQYYGLYTNLERFDKEFLQRNYGHDEDDGDLWSGGRILENNETTFTWDRIDAFWAIDNVAQLDGLSDLDASMREWAAEMVAGDVDGYGNGGANFMIYDHPTRGFIWLPTDADTSFDPDFLPADSSPVFAPSPFRWELDWYHYLVVMNDPAGFERFVSALSAMRAKYDVAALQRDIDTWTTQIADAATTDPRRPFTMGAHAQSVAVSRTYVADRARAIDAWLTCRRDGGPDRDNDGHDLCHDCDDRQPGVNPGAPEACNLRDDDCNGQVDDVAQGQACE